MANGTDSNAGDGAQTENEQSSETLEGDELVEQTIREALAGSKNEIFKQVTEHFVDREVNKRVELLVKAIDKLRQLSKEIKKLRPDHVVYDPETGEKALEAFTKTQIEAKNKLKERRDKLVKATNKALNNLDYDGLEKALGGDK